MGDGEVIHLQGGGHKGVQLGAGHLEIIPGDLYLLSRLP
jgi:hypothetical protein